MGNVSPEEEYPISIAKGVKLILGSVCVPGVAGKVVFLAGTDKIPATLSYGIVGMNCQGVGSGASVGLHLKAAPNKDVPPVNALLTSMRKLNIGYLVQAGTFSATQPKFIDCGTAYRIDGGSVTDDSNTSTGSLDYGVDCRSTTDPSAQSIANLYGGTYGMPKVRGLWAGHNCAMTATYVVVGVGQFVPCESLAPGVGVYVEGNAKVTMTSGHIKCMAQGGVRVHADPTNKPGVPDVVLANNKIRNNGCAGLLADHGKVTAFGNAIVKNHWGVIQRGEAVLAEGPIRLVGQDKSGTTARNTLACNGKAAGGACCTEAACPVGYDVWNHSASPLDASFNFWQESPVTQYNCNKDLGGCQCVFTAQCMTSPPDGTPVVNSPMANGTAGKTTTKNNALGRASSLFAGPPSSGQGPLAGDVAKVVRRISR